MDFQASFQTVPSTFLPLSTEVSEPFVIPNMSPTSSPTLEPAAAVNEAPVSVIGLNDSPELQV